MIQTQPPTTARRAQSGGRTARQQQQQQHESDEPQSVTYVRYAPHTRTPAILPDDTPVEPVPSTAASAASMLSGRPLSHLSRMLLAMHVDPSAPAAATSGQTPRAHQPSATVKRGSRPGSSHFGLPPSPKLSFMGHAAPAAVASASAGSASSSSKRAQSPRVAIESLRPTPEEFADAAAALASPLAARSASAHRASALTQDAISPWTLSAAADASADLPEPAQAIDHFGALIDDAQRNRSQVTAPQQQRPDTAAFSDATAASIHNSSLSSSSGATPDSSRPTTSGTGFASSAALTSSVDPASSQSSLQRPDTASSRASDRSLERLHAAHTDAAPISQRAHDHFPPPRHRSANASSARRHAASAESAAAETPEAGADGFVRDAEADGSDLDDDESEGQREDFFASEETAERRYDEEEKQEQQHSPHHDQRAAAASSPLSTAAATSAAAASSSGATAAAAAPFSFPIDPRSMKASHRLILEKLYGKDRAERILSSSGQDQVRASTARQTPATNTGRHMRATSGSSGRYSVPPSAPNELLSVAVAERRSRVPGLQLLADGLQTPGSIQRVREGTATLLAGPSASKPSTTPIVSHLPPTAPGAYRVGSADALSPRAVIARTPREYTRGTLVSSEALDPRFTQRAHSARLSTGQTIVRAPGQTSEWPYLTARRKAQEEEMRERARLRVERMQARGGFRSTEAESARAAYVPAAPVILPPNPKRDPLADIPAHELGEGALPSKKRARRPPAQSAFRDVSLSAGVLAKVERNRPQQYRVSAAAPLPSPPTAAGGGSAGAAGSGGTAAGAGSAGAGAGFHLTSDPRLSTWRQDVNSWLSAHAKHVSKSVSVAQMAELRVLYDALDDDGGDSLDLDELATAMRVCGLKAESARGIALRLLGWMNKSKFDSLSFAEFAYAVLHFEVPAHSSEMGMSDSSSGGSGGKAAFGSQLNRTIPLFHKMMSGPAAEGRASFAQVVFEFKRQRTYAAMHKATGIEI